MGKARMEALTDGIFAFAMTLLVLNLEVPQEAPSSSAVNAVQALISGLAPDFMHYVIAFAILAGFWIVHHSFFEHIRVLDRKMMWLNIMSLLFVALLPFSTDLADTYVDFPTSALLFEANIFIIGALFWVQWNYACAGGRFLKPGVPNEHVERTRKGMLITPAISLLAMAVAFMGFTWSAAVFMLIPFAYAIALRK